MAGLGENTALTNELLLRALEPFKVYYDDPANEEIAINRPGEIFVKIRGEGWTPVEVEAISMNRIFALCRMLANVTDQSFNMNAVPILAATLPGGHRFQAILGPNVRYSMEDTHGIAMCIRRFNAEHKFRLDDFQLKPGEKPKQIEAAKLERNQKKRYSDFPYEDLIGAVDEGEAVLISGATSTGKTTFLNALVEYIPRDRRLITVEDTREIMVPHRNRVHFVVSRTESANAVTYTHILDTIVRMTPDIIICGEISIVNSKSIYRLMTTGHSNFMATIHAESPEMALRAFWQNLAQADPGLDSEAAVEILSRSFGRIVQIDRSSGQRVITAVDAPNIVKSAIYNATREGVTPQELAKQRQIAENEAYALQRDADMEKKFVEAGK